jgi:hypothetical protein
MASYQIELTAAEDAALSYVALSQQDWIDNAVKNRARIAIEEITKIAVEKCFQTNTPVPSTQDDLVALAFSSGWVKTGVQRDAEALAARQAELATLENQSKI